MIDELAAKNVINKKDTLAAIEVYNPVAMKFVSQDIFDMILMYLGNKDICKFGQENVSEYVWLRKKDRTVYHACENGNLVGVRYFINNTSERLKTSAINNAFNASIHWNQFDIMKYCIKQGADIHQNNDFAINYNVQNGRLETVKYLITCGIDDIQKCINAHTITNVTAHQNMDTLMYLIENHKLNISAYHTDILANIEFKNRLSVDIIKFCADTGADMTKYCNIILHAGVNKDRDDIIRYYMENNKDITGNGSYANEGIETFKERLTRLYKCIYNTIMMLIDKNNITMIQYLLTYITDVYSNESDIHAKIAMTTANQSITNTAKKYYVSINITDLLQHAISKGYLPIADYLITFGKSTVAILNTAVRISVINGKLAYMKRLIKRGAELTKKIQLYLKLSIEHGNMSIVKYLIKNGADLNTALNTSLDFDMKSGFMATVRFLIEYGADIGPMLTASIRNHRLVAVKYFITQGADVNQILEESIKYDSYNILKYFVRNDIDKNVALQFSIKYNKIYIINHIIQRHVDLNANNGAALLYSVELGHFNIVKLLIGSGADVHSNTAALLCSVNNNKLDIARCLIKYNANIHVDDDYIFRVIAKKNNVDDVKFLIKHGANIRANDDEALRYSIEHKHIDIIQCIVRQIIKSSVAIIITRNNTPIKFKTIYKHILECISTNIDTLRIVDTNIKNITLAIA